MGAQAEVRPRAAEADMGVGVRLTSKWSGSAKTDGSRLAAPYSSTNRSSGSSRWPDTVTGSVTVRRMNVTGDE